MRSFCFCFSFLFKAWICILGSKDTLPRSEFWKLLICQVTWTQTILWFYSMIGSVVWSSTSCGGRPERRGSNSLARAVMRFCSHSAGRRSLQNWAHPLVGHVGNLPSVYLFPLLALEECVGIQKWCMCPPGIHLFLLLNTGPDLADFWLHSLLWEGLWSSGGEQAPTEDELFEVRVTVWSPVWRSLLLENWESGIQRQSSSEQLFLCEHSSQRVRGEHGAQICLLCLSLLPMSLAVDNSCVLACKMGSVSCTWVGFRWK